MNLEKVLCCFEGKEMGTPCKLFQLSFPLTHGYWTPGYLTPGPAEEAHTGMAVEKQERSPPSGRGSRASASRQTDFISSYLARATFTQCKRSGRILSPRKRLRLHMYECLRCSSFWDGLMLTWMLTHSLKQNFTDTPYNNYMRKPEVSGQSALRRGLQNLKLGRNFHSPLVIEVSSPWPPIL